MCTQVVYREMREKMVHLEISCFDKFYSRKLLKELQLPHTQIVKQIDVEDLVSLCSVFSFDSCLPSKVQDLRIVDFSH